ncbi:oligosaccharide flippase family protein [Novosphingobium sp. FSY-8]|uniref:Oligosaccharide flippase family protein n=1 Tax=Novosphingobium ovatum TaxID=1908523 RepID=A0ABW9X8U3_9SPHN|nr:lipopolysaccharide biosynthesis protein [Novosphingobium ovatum]NBC34943.1 oligosaccharide flippase family protein [Novosphingobium ovatum]
MSGRHQELGAVRRFARAAATMGVLQVLSTGLTFAVGMMLARMLGAAQYGVYALAMTAATLAGLATEFGLPTLAMRDVGHARGHGEWGRARGVIRFAQGMVIGLSGAMALAAWGAWAAGWLDGRVAAAVPAMLWGLALIPAVALGKLRAQVLLALDHVRASQVPVLVLRPVLFLALCGGLWAQGRALRADQAMAAQVAAAGVAMVVLWGLWRRHRPAALVAAAPVMARREWLMTCAPMGMTEGLRLLQTQMTVLLVGALSGAAAAGHYRVADAVCQMTAMVASIVGTAATAQIARLHAEGDREGIARVAVLCAWAMVGGALGLGAVPLALGGWLFPALFGAEFAASWPLYAMQWCGWLVWAGCGIGQAIANMTGHHRLTTQGFATIVVLNGVLGLVLIPRWGAMGGAVALAVSLGLGSMVLAWRLWRVAGVNATVLNPLTLRLLAQAVARARGWRAARREAAHG